MRKTHTFSPEVPMPHAPVPTPRRRSFLVPLSAALALATGMGTWYALAGGDHLTAPAPNPAPGSVAAAKSLHLPWPPEGQASVEVEGIGSLGTRGEQRPVPIASVTKVMTAYVILRAHPMRAGAPGCGHHRRRAGGERVVLLGRDDRPGPRGPHLHPTPVAGTDDGAFGQQHRPAAGPLGRGR